METEEEYNKQQMKKLYTIYNIVESNLKEPYKTIHIITTPVQISEDMIENFNITDTLLNDIVSKLISKSRNKDSLDSYAAKVRDFVVKNGKKLKGVSDDETIELLKELAKP